jgi:hypothetical protein
MAINDVFIHFIKTFLSHLYAQSICILGCMQAKKTIWLKIIGKNENFLFPKELCLVQCIGQGVGYWRNGAWV